MTALTNKQKQEALRKRRAKLGLKRKEYWAIDAEHKKIKELLKNERSVKLTNYREVKI